MNHRISLFGSLAALFALIAMAVVAGCGGKGSNPNSVPLVPAEELVGKFNSPTATVSMLVTAATDAYGTLGYTNPASPLYGAPASANLANALAILQSEFNADTSMTVTVGQLGTKFGMGTPTAFATKLNSFVAANYNGGNSHLKSLARLIAMPAGSTSATPPTITSATALQPYQAFYVAVWAATPYAALERGPSDCISARIMSLSIAALDLYLDLYGDIIQRFDPSQYSSLIQLRAEMVMERDHYQSLCHSQG